LVAPVLDGYAVQIFCLICNAPVIVLNHLLSLVAITALTMPYSTVLLRWNRLSSASQLIGQHATNTNPAKISHARVGPTKTTPSTILSVRVLASCILAKPTQYQSKTVDATREIRINLLNRKLQKTKWMEPEVAWGQRSQMIEMRISPNCSTAVFLRPSNQITVLIQSSKWINTMNQFSDCPC
jgi:hypothetical protein